MLLHQAHSASLNNGSVRPRSERAELSGVSTSSGHASLPGPQNALNQSASGDQLEFDFVNLPGYGVLDDASTEANGNFSCYGRRYGYYADVARQCQLFHLCYPVKEPSNTDIAYQRFSFACSEQSQFDQQHLLCLEPSSVVTPCEQSSDHFEAANHRLVSALQQSAPGMFVLSEEGAVVNATAADAQAGAEPSVLDASAFADESAAASYGHEQFYV
jgi:hypothetical protein